MVSFKLPSSGKAIADLTVLPTVSKSRKPRFELHLKIYDLNNVPLVSGVSSVKWHLPHSIHGEHRGRTHKQPIANHRVEYNYSKIVPLRLVIDRNNRLADYPIEFEVMQEFENHGAGRDEKIVLGKITLNLAEYVAESEAILREGRPSTSDSRGSGHVGLDLGIREGGSGSWHSRKRSSLSTKGTLASSLGASPGTIDSTSMGGPASTAGSSTASISTSGASLVEDGVVRRYLMQDSKINSTLKIGVLMVQVDGERNYVAPPLKSAPVFGGIAGIMASGEVVSGAADANGADEPDESTIGGVVSALVSSSAAKGRDTTEVQDVYRRALAASWACQPGELPADECIEDIFRGGDGFRTTGSSAMTPTAATSSSAHASGKSRTAIPAGSSLGSVSEGPGWSMSSYAHSTNERDEDEAGSPGLIESMTYAKKGSRILPKLAPIRRKTLPLQLASGRTPTRSTKDHDQTSSGEDGSTAGSGSGSASGGVGNDDDDDLLGGNATLRPSDLRKLRGHPISTSSSSSALAAMHLHGREDSGLSDRTVTPRGDSEMQAVPRSNRSSPGPQASSGLLRRNDSFGSGSGSAAQTSRPGSERVTRGDSGRSSGRSSGRVRSSGGHSSGNGSGHEDQPRRTHEVNEYEVRDDFVAWQLPGPVPAST